MAKLEQRTITLPLGGEYTSGAPDLIPASCVRLQYNTLSRPGRWVKRPPLITEGLSSVVGMANWNDETNQVVRVIAFTRTGATVDLNVKSATQGVETYAGAVTGITENGYVSDFANYKGVIYYTVTSGVAANARPAGLHSYNGTTVTQYPLGGETLQSLTVTPFIDRLILGYVRADVTNQLGTTSAYGGWSAVTTAGSNITNGSTVTVRITPTATTLSQIYAASVYTAAASTTDTSLVYRADMRSVSPTYAMPLTFEIYYSQIWVTLTAYTLGAIRVPTPATGNGFRYRVTVAGTSAAGEPVWPLTVGTTVADGTVTWICDGPDAIGSTPTTIPSLTDAPGWTSTWVTATIAANPSASNVGTRIKFGTTATPTITLAPMDFSFKDGLADGTITKQNYGQQLTKGKFFYPFFNQESSATATINLENDLYWTETSDPSTIRGSNFYRLRDLPGRVTASATVGGRYVVFKREGMWVFQGTADPDSPLVRERFIANVGCLGPRALTVFEDTLYFVGENEVYSYKPGGEPQPLCGDGMREEIMARGSSWREYQGSSGTATVISVSVDQTNRDLIVSPQTFCGYTYNLDRKHWSLGFTANAAFTCGLWNPNTNNLYFAGTRVAAATNTVAQDSTGAVSSYITFPPIEPGSEVRIDRVILHTIALSAQTSQTFTVAISLDDGATFTHTNSVTIPLSSTAPFSSSPTKARFPVAMRVAGPRPVIRLEHTGSAGASIFALAKAEAEITILGPERQRVNPVQGAVTP